MATSKKKRTASSSSRQSSSSGISGIPHWIGNEVRRVGVHVHDAGQLLRGAAGKVAESVQDVESGWGRMKSALGQSDIGKLYRVGQNTSNTFESAANALKPNNH